MQSKRWKACHNYVLMDILTTGLKHRDIITRIVMLKVENDKIIDTFDMWTYDIDIKKIFWDMQKFIGRKNIVGWCIDFDIDLIEWKSGIRFNNNYVDVFEPYYRSYKHSLAKCSLKNVYNLEYSHTFHKKGFNFNDPIEKCLATKQLYESIKRYNLKIKEIYKKRA